MLDLSLCCHLSLYDPSLPQLCLRLGSLLTSTSHTAMEARGEEAPCAGTLRLLSLRVGWLALLPEVSAEKSADHFLPLTLACALEAFATPQCWRNSLVCGTFTMGLLCAGTWAVSGPAKAPSPCPPGAQAERSSGHKMWAC